MQHPLRSLALILTLTLALGASLAAAAAPQWAVTTSLSKVFVVKYDGGSVTSYEAAQFSQSNLAGVSSYHGYVFVADNSTSGTTSATLLHVGRIVDPLTNPTIQWLGTSAEHPMGTPISLEQGSEVLQQPGAVAVDENGGVYVLGGRYRDSLNQIHSNYAYITSATGTWTDASVKVVNLWNTSFADIATNGSQAIIANRVIGSGFADQTWTTAVTNGAPTGPAYLNDNGYFPRGIAVGTNGYSYIANYSTEVTSPEGPANVGSISVVNNNPLASKAAAIALADFRPTDIAFLTVNGIDYLGLVGIGSGGSEARRYTLDANGMPVLEGFAQKELDDSADHFGAASGDGTLFWVTNPQANTVTVLDTLNWTVHSVGVAGTAGYITTLVPEPSSIIALLTGAVGLLGLRRRRNRRS